MKPPNQDERTPATKLDRRARRTMALLYRRLLEAGLWRHISTVEGAVTTGSGGAYFTTSDNRAFVEDLLSTGRFCRDTPRGGLLHPGQTSVREITDGAALHLSLAEDHRIYVHIDRVSPANGSTAEGICRYDRARSLAHIRREVFPLVMKHYRTDAGESKGARRAREDLYDAQRAWCEAVESDRTEESIEAGIRLAGHLAAEDESARKRAETLYREAIASNHEEFAPAAAFGLGVLFEERNESSQAEEAYALALNSGHPEFAPWAAYSLGSLLERLDRPSDAGAAYERAVASGHPDVTSWAALRLADLLAREGDHPKAIEVYGMLVSLRHPECAALGAIGAARLLRYLGESEAARSAYEQAMALGPLPTARVAATELQRMNELRAGSTSGSDPVDPPQGVA